MDFTDFGTLKNCRIHRNPVAAKDSFLLEFCFARLQNGLLVGRSAMEGLFGVQENGEIHSLFRAIHSLFWSKNSLFHRVGNSTKKS